MKYAGLGGSSVPAAITRRLTDLGITVFRSYGSTEHPSITGCHPNEQLDKRAYTDGRPLAGVEIRFGEDGEILSRGPDLCRLHRPRTHRARIRCRRLVPHRRHRDSRRRRLPHHHRPQIRHHHPWWENISALEVEETLLTMPSVAEAVAVSAPDARLGEHVAAVLRLRPGCDMPTIDEVQAHFAAAGLAKQKWPRNCAGSMSCRVPRAARFRSSSSVGYCGIPFVRI